MRKQANYQQQLEQKIAKIEAAMAVHWRKYRFYEPALIKAKLLLQIQINNHVALAAKKAAQRTQAVMAYLAKKAERLREANPIAYFRLYMPRAYDWGITNPNDFEVIE